MDTKWGEKDWEVGGLGPVYVFTYTTDTVYSTGNKRTGAGELFQRSAEDPNGKEIQKGGGWGLPGGPVGLRLCLPNAGFWV